MSKANLTLKADLSAMTKLVDVESLDRLERPGEEPTTDPDEFEGRNGYEPDFLDGWDIKLPLPKERDDLTKIKRGGNGVELKYQNFSVAMSKSRRLPVITAANIDGDQSKRLPRISTWSYDGRIDAKEQWGDSLYYENALDRGHMVRREDPVWGNFAKRANIDTFHFTNSCPQMAGVNQKTWVGLEDHILKNAKVHKLRVNVYTGPFFSDNDLEYRDALVPLAFWKVVAIVTEKGRPSATAYRVSQEKELDELEFVYAGYKTFQISIREVSERTGIDFGELVEYDGFSRHESATGQRIAERLDTLESVRV